MSDRSLSWNTKMTDRPTWGHAPRSGSKRKLRRNFQTSGYTSQRKKKRLICGHLNDDHRRLIKYLQQSSDPQLQRLGYDHLPRLRSARNQADYELDFEFTKGQAEDALELAAEVIFDYLPK